MSQDPHDSPSHHDLLDASSLFLADLQAAALAAWEIINKADVPKIATQNMGAAWLQGFGDNLARAQAWIIEHGNPFAHTGVEEVQLLFRLNMLHSQVKEAITVPDVLALSRYLESSANVIQLFKEQPGIEPGIVNIGFLLGTLRDALECFPQNRRGIGPKPPQEVSLQARKQKIDIFIAADASSVDFAEQLAATLGEQKVEFLNIKIVRSWTRLPDLSKHALPGMVTAISSCQYGALVLRSQEVTVDAAGTDPSSSRRRFRLSADLEFLLGLMVGILNFQNTFLVVPTTQETQLSQLLIGIGLASYDPDDTDGNTMDNAAYKIKMAISDREKAK